MSKPPVPGNKPGEPTFQMKLDPDSKILFKYKLNEPCTVELKIVNTLKERQTFKVKCTDNDIFRVRPPLSFVKPDESAVVKITLTAKTVPENNRHFFAIYHMKSEDAAKTARQVWTPESKPDGVARIIASFEEVKGDAKKDEKKEEPKKEEKKDDKKDAKKEEPKKEEPKKEEKKEETKKEEVKKEDKKDETKKEETKKEDTKKEEPKKDEEKKDETKKEEPKKEEKKEEKK